MANTEKLDETVLRKVADIAGSAIRAFGTESQIDKFREETQEATEEAKKFLDENSSKDDLAGEVADVLITAFQMRYLMRDEVDAAIGQKLIRLRALIDKEMVVSGRAKVLKKSPSKK